MQAQKKVGTGQAWLYPLLEANFANQQSWWSDAMQNDDETMAGLTGRPPLRDLAEAQHRRIGTAVNTNLLAAEPAYQAILAREFSSVTPENVMKWALVEPQRGVFDYAAADRLVDFARQHSQVVRGHTLVWHNQVPGWLTETSFSPSELADILRAHIADEASHFRGAIDAWDVVNEPFNEDGTWRDTIWFRALGPDYVGLAFEWAQAADPHARLYLNDYDVESINPKSDAMYALLQDLLARGIPVHGAGFQAHLAMDREFPSTLRANLERFAALDLDLAITEADVRVMLPPSPEKLATQADYFARLMRACLDVPRCVSFTVWGFADAHSWIPGWFQGYGAATVFDDRLQPKPAYAALSDVLDRTLSP